MIGTVDHKNTHHFLKNLLRGNPRPKKSKKRKPYFSTPQSTKDIEVVPHVTLAMVLVDLLHWAAWHEEHVVLGYVHPFPICPLLP